MSDAVNTNGVSAPHAPSDSAHSDATIRVLVVDDSSVFRVGLARMLAEHGLEVAGQARDGAEAITLATRLVPDVIVMDLNLPGVSGVEATRRLAITVPQARVLVLTVSESDTDVMDALMAGACGYLLKGASIEEVMTGIRGAARGDAVIYPSIATKLLDRIRSRTVETDGTPRDVNSVELSNREIEILRLMANGKENKEIAQELFISPQTVKNHISNILAKLQIDNRIQAAVYAVQQGLV